MEQQIFSSRISSILTLLGVAIGLGNVWRFPYMMGSYGGSAFLFVYFIFTLLFAVPALMAEMALGQMSGLGTVDALRIGLGKKAGNFLGYLLLFVITVSGSYYATIVANVFFTTCFSLVVGFSAKSNVAYQEQLSNTWLQYGITVLLILASLYVIRKGLAKGIEYVSKIVMPLFFLTLIYMIVHVLLIPGALTKGLEFLHPDWSLMGASEIFAAMGQAFFSVGLGGTFVVVYASFFKKNENIPLVALFTGLGDMSASVLISLFIVPAVLVFGLDMTTGPTLIFQTFPQLFNSMPGGRLVGSLFMLAIFIVAFLSLVAAYQVPFTTLQHEWPSVNRRKILYMIGALQLVLALPSNIYPGIISVLDLIFGSGMQVLGSAFCIFGLTWGINRVKGRSQLFQSDRESNWHSILYIWIKWAIPLALLSVLFGYLTQ
ncbi:sodium-dependent transporter [soil metagenome]